MQQHIEEERTRPLEVNKAYIDDYEMEQNAAQIRLEKAVQRHISCLRQLRGSMEKRENAKKRSKKLN